MPQMKMYGWLQHLIAIQFTATIFYFNKFYLSSFILNFQNKLSKKNLQLWSW